MFLQCMEQLSVLLQTRFLRKTEFAADPEAKEKYPFSYITRNSLFRVHATYSNIPFMLMGFRTIHQKVFMNPDDASAKGLVQGDVVESL